MKADDKYLSDFDIGLLSDCDGQRSVIAIIVVAYAVLWVSINTLALRQAFIESERLKW